MKRITLLTFFLIVANFINAQIPEGYYDAAEGLNQQELKTALYNIIKGHTEFPYTDSETDVWDILKETDRDPENPDNVILVYTGWSVDAAQEYNSGNGWEREHVWAKIHGDFGTNPPCGTDIHHLKPVNGSINSTRNSRWFSECDVPIYADNILTDCFKSNTEWTFEPRDEVKGDVARMVFYMATRYEGENNEPDLEVINYLPSDNNTTEPVMAKLSDLLAWNEADPVDEFEQNRNNVIYSYQGNRNPYIDHPEYVNLIWNFNSYIQATFEDINFEIFPNPALDFINIKSNYSGTSTIQIYNINSELIYNDIFTNNIKLDISSYDTNIYYIKIQNSNKIFVKKFVKIE